MRTHLFAASVLAAFLFSPWPAASAAAQDHSNHGASAATMACCAGHQTTAAPAPPAAPMACCAQQTGNAAPAMAMACCDGSDPVVAAAGLGLPEKPVVQTLTVNFMQPVRVGEAVLLGRYVIEHDDARMARGEPCTYIYAAADRREPVVTFHCTHLERKASEVSSVVVTPADVSGIRRLLEFQYGGDAAAHGMPAVR